METKELPTVTQGLIKDVFRSRDFAKEIKKATEIGLRIGGESQFSFWRGAYNNKIKCFPVPTATCHYSPASTAFEITPEQNDSITDRQLIPLVFYHFHPLPSTFPSEADLKTHFDLRNQYGHIAEDRCISYLNNYPIDCIGTVRDKGNVHEVLVFQNCSSAANSLEGEYVHHQIKENLGRRTDDSDLVARNLDNLSDWNAALLTYEKKGNGFYLPEVQLSGLEKFDYTPTIRSRETLA